MENDTNCSSQSNEATQSPSLALLERLQQLRKWQEQQREALMRTHSGSSMNVSSDSLNYSKTTSNLSLESYKGTPDSRFSRSSVSSLTYPNETTQKQEKNTPLQKKDPSKEAEDYNIHQPPVIVRSQSLNDSVFSRGFEDTPDSQMSKTSSSRVSQYHENVPTGNQVSAFKKPNSKGDLESSFRGGGQDDSISGFSDLHAMKKGASNIDSYHAKSFTTQIKESSKAPLVKPVLRFAQSPEDQSIRNQAKSFDEILEEKLMGEGLIDESKQNFKPKRQFLKKKSGLSRYEGIEQTESRQVEMPRPAFYRHLQTSPTEPVQVKPKQKFLKKGEGTARFRMAPLRLRKRNVIQVPEKEMDGNLVLQHHEESPEKLMPTTPIRGTQQKNLMHTYPSKISNRPIHKLQLKEVPRKTTEPDIQRSGQNYGSKERGNENEQADKLDNDIRKEKLSGDTSVPPVIKELEEDKRRRKEQEELTAFEKLEELAADSSFSSNSSTVWHLLQRGQRSTSSTPLRSPPPFTAKETPIAKFGNQTQESNIVSRNLLQRLVQVGVLPKEPFLNKEKKDQSKNCQVGSQGQAKQQAQAHQRSQLPQQLLSVSAVLEQLRSIIRLENCEDLEMSQEDLQTLLESFANPDVHSPLDSHTQFVNGPSSNWTSTPAHLPIVSHSSGPRVHFRSEGVEVLEYEPSDTEPEDTLTDAPSIAEDDTDLVTTSDLEALALFNMQKLSKDKSKSSRESPGTLEHQSTDDESTSTLIEDRGSSSTPQNKVKPLALQFSPPPQRPYPSASEYIWSIFGKERDARRDLQGGKHPSQHTTDNKDPHKQKEKAIHKIGNLAKNKPHPVSEHAISEQKDVEKRLNEEIESHKALLLAKMCELEKETDSFKNETIKLKNLQQSLQNEKKHFAEEKQALIESLEKEKVNFQKYVDRERNNLWKEKQELKRTAPSLTMVQDKSLEIVYLKEQMQDLQEEMQRKESLNQFTVKKLNDKIKSLEQENKQLKEKNNSLQMLEKENLDLKHKLDRTKLSKKTALKDTQNNPVRGPKLKKKTMTIDGINESLSKRLTDLPSKPVTSHKEVPTSSKNMKNHPLLKTDSVPQLVQKGTLPPMQSSEMPTDLMQDTVQSSEDVSVVNKTEKQIISPVGKADSEEYTEYHKSDGSTEVIYANGNKKVIFPNGSVIVSYYNGDRKEVHGDRTVYVYGTDQTSHITYNDGKEVLQFPNGQKETRFPDGSSEIVFADNSKKTVSSDGTEVCTMKDGTVVRTNADGSKVFEFPSGQREIHTHKEKRREYPDGTVKILHTDGRTETRYKMGRVRIKDREGNVVSDTHQGVH